MPSKNQRRTHTKSKKGCGQCKLRRIKCNEVYPVCQNCARREIACDFSTLPTPPLSNPADSEERRASQSRSATAAGQPSTATSTATTPAIDPFLVPNLIGIKKTTDLDVSDLELMHHWSSNLSVDLASNQTPDGIALWQTHAVALGFKYEFLLRGILAASALHLGYLRPELKKQYEIKASAHQNVALSLYLEELNNITAVNCHALFAFGCLLILISFATSTKKDAKDFQTDVLYWFHLLRGCSNVLAMHRETLGNSFLAPLLNEMKQSDSTSAHHIKDSDHIIDLIPLCCDESQGRETSQAYALAIHDLLRVFIQASILRQRGEGAVLASLVWPINLSPKYLELLAEQRPEAMVILAHYSVLIQWCDDDQEWFMKGWAKFMLDTIKASIPESWYPRLAWPNIIIG